MLTFLASGLGLRSQKILKNTAIKTSTVINFGAIFIKFTTIERDHGATIYVNIGHLHQRLFGSLPSLKQPSYLTNLRRFVSIGSLSLVHIFYLKGRNVKL